jgi:hypothetical protein
MSGAREAGSVSSYDGWPIWRVHRDGQWLGVDELRQQFRQRRV